MWVHVCHWLHMCVHLSVCNIHTYVLLCFFSEDVFGQITVKATQPLTHCPSSPELGLNPAPGYHGSSSLAYWSNITTKRNWMKGRERRKKTHVGEERQEMEKKCFFQSKHVDDVVYSMFKFVFPVCSLLQHIIYFIRVHTKGILLGSVRYKGCPVNLSG